jgi:hypothetical protein
MLAMLGSIAAEGAGESPEA